MPENIIYMILTTSENIFTVGVPISCFVMLIFSYNEKAKEKGIAKPAILIGFVFVIIMTILHIAYRLILF